MWHQFFFLAICDSSFSLPFRGSLSFDARQFAESQIVVFPDYPVDGGLGRMFDEPVVRNSFSFASASYM